MCVHYWVSSTNYSLTVRTNMHPTGYIGPSPRHKANEQVCPIYIYVTKPQRQPTSNSDRHNRPQAWVNRTDYRSVVISLGERFGDTHALWAIVCSDVVVASSLLVRRFSL